MVEVTAQMVAELRQKTQAKLMDAKRALVEAAGDMTKAIEILRERGQAEAAKRTHRTTAEGTITTAQAEDHSAAGMIELNCETDFVAKTDQFRAIAQSLANWMLGQSAEAVTAADLPAEIVASIQDAITKTGENIQFRRGVKFFSANGVVESYLHLGGKIGVLVQVDGATGDAVRALAKDLSMQVAAAVPEFVTREDVAAETIEKEMEIYRTQARNEGKPEQILDRIAEGKLQKYFKDTCLLEQPFIKDPDKAVKALVDEVSKSVGTALTVKRFMRFQLGQ